MSVFSKNVLCNIARFVLATALSLCILLGSVTSFAYDSQYMNPDNWVNQDKIYSNSIYQSGPFGTLTGDYMYYFDSDDACMYLYLTVSEPNISTNDDVVVEIRVDNGTELYSLSVGNAGIISASADNISSLFTVNADFSTYSNSSGTYIIALDIHDGSDVNVLSFNVHTVSKYVIRDLSDITVVSTTKSKKSTKSTTKKTKTTTTKQAKTKRASTTRVTKYYNSNATIKTTKYDDTVSTTADSSFNFSDEIVEFVSPTPAPNTRSVAFRIVGIVLGLIGLLLVLIAIVSKIISKAKKQPTDDAADPDDDEFDF